MKRAKRGPKRMQDLGWVAVTVFVKKAAHRALRRYAFEEGVSAAEIVRRLVEAELKEKGYL